MASDLEMATYAHILLSISVGCRPPKTIRDQTLIGPIGAFHPAVPQVVSANDWCGEYQPADKAAATA